MRYIRLGKGEFSEQVREFAEDERYQRLKDYTQHGNISTYTHCLRVARKSHNLARRLHIRVNEKEMLKGAMLHDYFLYDWHEKSDWHRLHGFSHAERALKNASRDFDLTYREKEIIRCHMFPLNITKGMPYPRALTVHHFWRIGHFAG